MSEQFTEVIIVDNSSSEQTLPDSSLKNVSIIPMPDNLGLGGALNAGIREAQLRGYAYAVLFDQDSCPNPHFASSMEAFAQAAQNFSTIGGCYSNKMKRACNNEKALFPKTIVITSGSLVHIAVWKQLGGFREDFFIDHVDHEYCLRSQKNGFEVLFAPSASFRHAIGFPEKHRLLGRQITCSNHAPFRYYYIFRNFILMARTLFFSHVTWFLSMGFVLLPKMFIKAMLFEPHKLKKINCVLHGIMDGMMNKSGKRSDDKKSKN